MAIIEQEGMAQLNGAVIPIVQSLKEGICVPPSQGKSLMGSAEQLDAILWVCPLSLQ